MNESWGEQGEQRAARAPELGSSRARRDAGHLGDLVVRVTTEVVQHENRSRSGWEPGDRGIEVDPIVRTVGGARGTRSPQVVGQRHHVTALVASDLVQDDVHGETVQPCGDGALTAKRRQPLPRANERVLHELLRFALVARHAPAQQVDRRGVRTVERFEGRDVTRLRPPNQRQIVGGVRGLRGGLPRAGSKGHTVYRG